MDPNTPHRVMEPEEAAALHPIPERHMYMGLENAAIGGNYFARLYGVTYGEQFKDMVKTFVGFDTTHNCKDFVGRVHKCLDDHNDNFDFCRSHASLMEACLRTHWNYSK